MEKTPEAFPGGLKLVQGGIATHYDIKLGDNYLLCSERSGFVIRFRRFFLSDIEMITVVQTQNGAILNILVGTLGLALVLLAGWNYATVPPDTEFPVPTFVIVLLILSIPPLLTCLVSLLLGPTCKTVLYTPVYEEHLRTLNRLRSANRAVDRLAERIRSLQPPVDRDGGTYTAAARVQPRPSHTLEGAPDTATGHMLFFLTLIALSASITFLLISQGWNNFMLDRVLYITIGLSAILLIIWAVVLLIRSYSRPISTMLRLCVAATLLSVSPLIVTMSFVQFGISEEMVTPENLINPETVFAVGSIYLLVYATLGIWGLLAVQRYRNALKPPPDSPV